MKVSDVFNTVSKGDEFYSHAIGYIAEGKEKKPVELFDWNDANRILYLGEESFYYGHLSLSQNCLRVLQGLNSRESMVIFDGDGSIFKTFSDYPSTFKTDDYTVKRIDLSNPSVSDGWNVLKTACTPIDKKFYWAPTDRESAVSNFVGTVMEYSSLKDSARWSITYKRLWLYAIVNCAIDEEDLSLYGLNELLQMPVDILKDKLFRRGLIPKYFIGLITDQILENIHKNILNCLHMISDNALTELLSKDGLDFSLPFHEKCIYFITIPEDKGIFLDLLCQELLKAGRMYLTDCVEPYGRERDGSFPIPVHLLFNCPMPKHLFSVMERYFTEFLPHVGNLSATFSFKSIMDIPRSFAYHFRTVVFQNLIDQETVEFASNLLYFNSLKEEIRYMRPNEIRKKLSYYYIAAIRGKGCFFVNPLSFDELDAAELENDELSELEEQDFS